VLRRDEKLNIIRQEAYSLIKKCDYDNGILKLIEAGQRESDANSTVGHFAEHRKDFQNAIKFYTKSNTYFALQSLAKIYEKMNKLEDAAQFSELSISKANGNKPEAIARTISLYKKAKNIKKLEELAEKYDKPREFPF
jgi:thioredoxin-like negative regulator of GroEL